MGGLSHRLAGPVGTQHRLDRLIFVRFSCTMCVSHDKDFGTISRIHIRHPAASSTQSVETYVFIWRLSLNTLLFALHVVGSFASRTMNVSILGLANTSKQ